MLIDKCPKNASWNLFNISLNQQEDPFIKIVIVGKKLRLFIMEKVKKLA